MFKKIMSIALVLVCVIAATVSASALCASEDDRPGIVGLEHIEAIKEINDSYINDGFEFTYEVRMVHTDDYWVVMLEARGDSDYMAMGFYDHMPNAKEIDVLWANRMHQDEIADMLQELGF
ncbi:MAG: hypothetical protein IKZ08_02675 [Bacteroidales bacterium]|nr:hypothetical protein [Bacteroidales bacterium]